MRGVYLSSFEPLVKLDPTKAEDRELAIELLLAANYMDCWNNSKHNTAQQQNMQIFDALDMCVCVYVNVTYNYTEDIIWWMIETLAVSADWNLSRSLRIHTSIDSSQSSKLLRELM